LVKADCHPERKHKARGLCKSCYDKTDDRKVAKKARAAATRPSCLLCQKPMPYPSPRKEYHKDCRKKLENMSCAAYTWKYRDSFENYKLSRGCEKCGYNKCAAALDFHHKDPKDKKTQIGRYAWYHKTEASKKEIEKCILLCGNCHREEHWNNRFGDVQLRVYLAAHYPRKQEIRKYALELHNFGIVVSSTWLQEPHPPTTQLSSLSYDENIEYAIQDLSDIDDSDVLVLFTEDPELGVVRGGRHFESGYAYAAQKTILTVGPRENLFHYLEDVPNFPEWDNVRPFLLEMYVSKRKKNTSNPVWID